MSISLYQSIIPTYLQILGAVAALLDKAEAYCESNNLPAETLTEASLADDMLPFSYQVCCVAWHSETAIASCRGGVFTPPSSQSPSDFASLRERISQARSKLQGLTKEEVDGFLGKPVQFQMGDFSMDFVAEEFLFSFSQPNFFFHATTAYDILRWKGLKIGKMDFMGAVRKLS